MSDSPHFPILDQIAEAGSPAAVAALLLRVPDAIVLDYQEALTGACKAIKCGDGVGFIASRVATLHAVRDAHGLLPWAIAQQDDYWRQQLSRLAAGRA